MDNRKKYYFRISSHHRLIKWSRIREVWRYRDLIWLMTKRSFQLGYKQTILGPLWMFFGPVFSSLVYTIVFGGVAHIQTDGVPKILFYLVSTTVWGFFASSLTGNASTFTSNAGIFGKVYFPRMVVPLSNVLSGLIRLGIHSIIIIGVLVYFIVNGAVTPNLHVIWMLPPALLVIGVMGMSCGIIISSVTTKYRDLSMLVGFVVTLWMYITPVVYPISQVEIPWLSTLLIFNPMTIPMEVVRFVLFGKAYFNLISLLVCLVFTVAVSFFGIMLFNKVERNFMDTV